MYPKIFKLQPLLQFVFNTHHSNLDMFFEVSFVIMTQTQHKYPKIKAQRVCEAYNKETSKREERIHLISIFLTNFYIRTFKSYVCIQNRTPMSSVILKSQIFIHVRLTPLIKWFIYYQFIGFFLGIGTRFVIIPSNTLACKQYHLMFFLMTSIYITYMKFPMLYL